MPPSLNPLQRSAAMLAAAQGNSRPTGLSRTVIAPEHQAHLAALYHAAPEFDRNALPAYKALREETGRQFDHLTAPQSKGGLGVNVEVSPTDPYRNAAELFDDLKNGHMKILATGGAGGEHPLMTNDENDQFRAVHDAFGHVATGRGFDRHGEEAAYQSHASMFSPLARQALATETRGQNAAMIHAGGVFPVQKVALLPGATGSLSPIAAPRRQQLFQQAMEFHRQAGLGG